MRSSVKRRSGGVAGLALLAVSAVGCGRDGGPPGPALDSAPRELQGAVLIVLDTVRADRVSAYGYSRATTPTLDRLAADGVLFEQVVSFAPWTLPSLATILSGKRADAVYVDNRLRESLVQTIGAAGYRTAAITEGGFFSSYFGFDLGFEHYVEEEGAVQLVHAGKRRDPGKTGGIETTFRLAGEWIAAHRQERFFLMIHTYEPHSPYRRHAFTEGLERGVIGDEFRIEMLSALRREEVRLSDPELDYLSALYDGGILESDRHVGAFLRRLEKEGLRDRTLVVVTSDHGEELGEHYRSRAGDHGHALFDDQLLVPLIFHHPLESYPVTRVAAQVRTMDILPTMAEILGAGSGDRLDGASLVPLMRGAEQRGRPAVGGSTKGGPPRAFLRHLDYKFVAVLDPRQGTDPLPTPPPRYQLYDLRADPGERDDLAATRPELTRRLLGILHETAGGGGRPTEVTEPVDGELRERLRSLGYLQ